MKSIANSTRINLSDKNIENVTALIDFSSVEKKLDDIKEMMGLPSPPINFSPVIPLQNPQVVVHPPTIENCVEVLPTPVQIFPTEVKLDTSKIVQGLYFVAGAVTINVIVSIVLKFM